MKWKIASTLAFIAVVAIGGFATKALLDSWGSSAELARTPLDDAARAGTVGTEESVETRDATTAPDLVVAAGGAQVFRKDGVKVEFSVERLGGYGGPEVTTIGEGDKARLTFRVTDDTTGEGVSGLHLGAWLYGRPGQEAPDANQTKTVVQSLIQGKLQSGEATSLNSFYYVSVNTDNTMALIDPQLDFNRTRLRRIATLQAPGEDLVVTPDSTHILVTLPNVGRTAVVDSLNMMVRKNLATGIRPRQIEAQPDGRYAWILDDEGESVYVVDLNSTDLERGLVIGAGPKSIAFDDDGKRVFLVSHARGEVYSVNLSDFSIAKVANLDQPVRSIAFSVLSEELYLNTVGGGIRVFGTEQWQQRGQVDLAISGSLVADPNGRWIFALDPENDHVQVIDTANRGQSRWFETQGRPTQMAFTDGYAYVYCEQGKNIYMAQRSALEQQGSIPLLGIPIAATVPDYPRELGFGPMITPTPEDVSVLVAIPEEQRLYYYAEGMMAPMGSYRNYSRNSRAVAVIDRSLREIANGVYTVAVSLDKGGMTDVPFYMNQPTEIVTNFEIDVAPSAATRRKIERERPKVRVQIQEPPALITSGQPVEFEFMVSEGDGDDAKPVVGLKDLNVMAYVIPGSWQRRVRALEVGAGVYRAAIIMGPPGKYRVRCEVRSRSLDYGESPELRLLVSDAVAQKVAVETDVAGQEPVVVPDSSATADNAPSDK